MISEKEFDEVIHLPLVRHVASMARPFAKHEVHLPPIEAKAAANRSEMALACWIAVLTRIFLKMRGSASETPLIDRVWKFADGVVDIDVRVGIHGANHKFKITTENNGRTTFHLRIFSWNSKGERSCEFERFGSFRGGVAGQGIETLPVN